MQPRRLLVPIHAACLGGLCAAATLAAIGGWIGELLANLRLYFLLPGLALAILGPMLAGAAARRLALGLVALLASGWLAWPLLPYVAAGAPPAPAIEGRTLRLLQANLHSWAVDTAALRRLLEDGGADIAVLTEITPAQQPAYRALANLYPYQVETPVGRDNTFIVRLLSRRPMQTEIFHPVAGDYPVLQARFCEPGSGCVTLLSAHAPRPGPGRGLRNRVLEAIAGLARRAERRGDLAVAIGDFNITAFSPDFALLTDAGLRDTALGRGYPASWPVWLGRLGIGIDQVLVAPQIGVSGRWLGPDIGSDHYPLFVELVLPDGR